MKSTFALCIATSLCLFLSGCSAGMGNGAVPASSMAVTNGRMMGGQQPVSGANIILWRVNTNGTGATSLMTSAVTTNGSGFFSITGDYSTASCTSITQVYITGTGGNPGSGTNNALALMAALGPCLSLTPSTFIQINEVTTVAAVFALQQFFGATQGTTFAEGIAVGSSSQSVQGMINAFQTAQLLASVSSGATNSAVGSAGIESAKINTLANVISSCVNSTGSSSAQCQALFAAVTPANAAGPADTIQALLYIAANPANNVGTLFGLSTASPPFAPALSTAPFDWTLAVTYTNDGLNLPNLLGSDASGNIWITDDASSAEALVEITPSGAPAAGSPFLTGSNAPDLPQAVVPDTLGNIWVSAHGTSSTTGNRLYSFNPTTTSATTYPAPSGCDPYALAIDGKDDLYFACSALGYLYEFPNQISGAPSSTNLPAYPSSATQLGPIGTESYGMAIDGLGNVWVANTTTSSSPSLTEYATGNYGVVANSFTLSNGPVGIAVDHSNNVWASSGSSLYEYVYNSGGAYGVNSFSGGGLDNGRYLAVDGAGNIWVANQTATTISNTQYVTISEFNDSGVALSPAVSSSAPGGFAHASTANSPYPRGLTIDPSGNVWIAGCGLSTSCMGSTSFVLELVGAASPPIAPLATALANGQLGCCSFTPASPSPASGLPTINSFTASATSITAGQPVTLTWSISGATSSQLSGVTTAASSPVTIYPSASTTYTLTATNSVGSTASSIAITVTGTTQIASATIGSTAGQLVPSNFMGLGIGEVSFEGVFGEPATGTNPVMRQIIRNITQYGASPVTYKVTAYDTNPSNGYVPTAADISALSQLYTDVGATFFIGVNLAADNVPLAVSQAQAFASGMPAGSLLGLEIGNEPDNYTHSSEQYRTAPYYFLNDYANFAPSVLAALQTYQPSAKLVGPVWGQPATVVGGSSNIVNSAGGPVTLSNFLSSEAASNLAFVTQHGYANQCTGYSGQTDFLLSATAQNCVSTSYLLGGVAPAHAQGLLYRVGETNSITGGGVSGISNTFQAALWIMDWSAGLAKGGVDGINIFGDSRNQYYTMFTFNTAASNGQNTFTLNYVLPQYYGVLMFQQATQNGAKFLPVTTSATGNQVTYAWLDASSTIRVLVLNKDENATGTVTFTLPAGYGSGTVTRLLESTPNASPGYLSTTGVTLGGQTFDTSTNGVIQGTAYGEAIAPSNGVYTIALPVTSAALITIPQ
jgi:hypothetical protein